jgi:hypothetical protein
MRRTFQNIFDTFRDENGFVFGTNAAGVQDNGQVRNQGDPGWWGANTESASPSGWSRVE